MDRLTKSARSELMSSIGTKNTNPEILVQRVLDQMDVEYETHVAELEGKPDIVIRNQNIVIFVHGCFWHQHANCQSATRPKSNTAFWDEKLDANVARDRRQQEELEADGWRVLVLWECSVEDGASKFPKRIQTLLQTAS